MVLLLQPLDLLEDFAHCSAQEMVRRPLDRSAALGVARSRRTEVLVDEYVGLVQRLDDHVAVLLLVQELDHLHRRDVAETKEGATAGSVKSLCRCWCWCTLAQVAVDRQGLTIRSGSRRSRTWRHGGAFKSLHSTVPCEATLTGYRCRLRSHVGIIAMKYIGLGWDQRRVQLGPGCAPCHTCRICRTY